jgi:hypothetical protein
LRTHEPEVLHIHRFDGELILRAADPVLDGQVLHRLHVQRDSVDLRQLRLQSPDDVARARVALGLGLQVDQHAAAVERRVAAVDADERREARHRRIGEHDVGQRLLALGHRREGHCLRRLRNALDRAGVLHREEALRE